MCYSENMFVSFADFFVMHEECPVKLRLYVLTPKVMMFAFSNSIAKDDFDYFGKIIEGLRNTSIFFPK
jgi:hypothetical protein